MTSLRQCRTRLKPPLRAAGWLLVCASAAAPAAGESVLAREMLAAHNAVRAKFSLPPMVYTQIVWRETRQVGCAVARSSTPNLVR